MSWSDEPRRVTDALRHVRRELGAPDPGFLDAIRASWSELVGDALGAHSEPLHLRGGRLRIFVDDPAWAGQFRYLADQLVATLHERVPGAGVREISVAANRSIGDAEPDPTDPTSGP
ncbi:MAG: DUF721 domain-containing protein [Acidimicrobiia bacterium]|nr:DUF721 domain-containing protein [Acidimicrobiia bacterium]